MSGATLSGGAELSTGTLHHLARHVLKTDQTGGTTGFMKAFNAWKALPANKGKSDQALLPLHQRQSKVLH